jgi:hypothetical protein
MTWMEGKEGTLGKGTLGEGNAPKGTLGKGNTQETHLSH